MKLSILLFLAFCANFIYCADSDGKKFVFSFVGDDDITASLITNVIVIPLVKDSYCTFKYIQATDYSPATLQKTAYFGKTNEFSFDPRQVYLESMDEEYKFQNFYIKDFRIFATCTEDVKLIGRISDHVKGWGDLFEIPSIPSFSGTNFIFSVPTGFGNGKGTISFLPIIVGERITINYVGYLNNEWFANETVNYDTGVGHDQRYVYVYPALADIYDSATIAIRSSHPIMVTFASALTASSDHDDDTCGASCMLDYTTFFVPPAVYKMCHGPNITSPDQRLMTNDFTTSVYITPPATQFDDCYEKFKMIVYEKSNNSTKGAGSVSSTGDSAIPLLNYPEIASSAISGLMPMYRFGSIFNPRGVGPTGYGHFAHYIPSIQEWVTGNTQFYSLANNCFIEFFADVIGSNLNYIRLDGKPLNNYSLNNLYYFGTTYGHFIMPVQGFGIHTFQNPGNYVLYVICQNVNSAYNAAGYVTGFNQRKV
uniref:IgGFc_binding domain-containing protein n=1 Tax=Rhabditophanes sp. KR3021 TaxID=114890 RepID=A0AC35U9K8_9BILA